MSARISPDVSASVLRDYRAGTTYAEIERRYGISHGTIENIARRNGEKLRSKHETREDAFSFDYRESRLIASIQNGLSVRVAASLAQMSVSAAETVIARAKVACRL